MRLTEEQYDQAILDHETYPQGIRYFRWGFGKVLRNFDHPPVKGELTAEECIERGKPALKLWARRGFLGEVGDCSTAMSVAVGLDDGLSYICALQTDPKAVAQCLRNNRAAYFGKEVE